MTESTVIRHLVAPSSSGVDPRWAAVIIGCFALAGMAAGLAGRLLLRRLRRGAACAPPWCELAAGALSALVGARAAAGGLPWWWVPTPLLLGWLAVPLAAADLARRRLPDALTLPAYPLLGLALAAAAIGGPDPGVLGRAAVGGLAFGGAHALVRAATPGALGGGDVKLAGSLGAVLGAVGWPALAVAAILAAAVTLALSLALAIRARVGARARLSRRPRTSPRPRANPRPSPAPTPRASSPGRARLPAAPHGPGLLAATWLVATFPGHPFPPQPLPGG